MKVLSTAKHFSLKQQNIQYLIFFWNLSTQTFFQQSWIFYFLVPTRVGRKLKHWKFKGCITFRKWLYFKIYFFWTKCIQELSKSICLPLFTTIWFQVQTTVSVIISAWMYIKYFQKEISFLVLFDHTRLFFVFFMVMHWSHS